MSNTAPKSSWLLRFHVLLTYIFLYAPIIVLVIFSFNTDHRNANWQGFTLHWYGNLMHNEAVQRALFNSLKVGLSSTLIATTIGTMAALALSRYEVPCHKLVGFLVFVPLVIPEIVMGISILTLYLSLSIPLSIYTVIFAHVAFCIAYVTITVRSRLAGIDPCLEEAAADLGATRWATFRLITFPQMLPGIISGALLSFTLSFDDFVISNFTSGSSYETLTIHIYSMNKKSVKPNIYSLSTIIFFAVLVLLIVYNFTDSADDRREQAIERANLRRERRLRKERGELVEE